MRQEVKHFKRVNQNLTLIVDDLKLRQSGLQKQSDRLRKTMSAQNELIEKFKDETKHYIMANLEDYKKLKDGVNYIYKTYSLEDKKEEVESEDDNQNKTMQSMGKKTDKSKKKGGGKSADSDMFRDHFVKREHLEDALKQARDSIIKNKKFH
jgi:Ni,Fe-hydrogenase III component G